MEGVNSSEVWDPEHKNDDADGTNQHFGADQKLIIKMVSKRYRWKLVIEICLTFPRYLIRCITFALYCITFALHCVPFRVTDFSTPGIALLFGL